MTQPRSQTILLDLDGTLLDADDWALRMDFVYLMLKHLRRITGSSLKAYAALRSTRDALLARPRHRDKAFLPLLQRAMQAYHESTGRSPQEILSITEEVFPQLKRRFRARAGALDFVLGLRKRSPETPLILATNPVWSRTIIEHRMRWAGLDPAWFVGITSGEDFHHSKPHVEYYGEIVHRYDLVPARCFHVGNDWKMDLAAARLGMQVFILESKSRRSSKPSSGLTRSQQELVHSGTFEDLKPILDAWLRPHP